jgi:hypothetical protein
VIGSNFIWPCCDSVCPLSQVTCSEVLQTDGAEMCFYPVYFANSVFFLVGYGGTDC